MNDISFHSKQSMLPLPKGDSAYAKAKRAEYQFKNIPLAKYYYVQAIESGERTESAIKDLASLLHQEGKTSEACSLLQKYSKQYNKGKFGNLFKTLSSKMKPSGSSLNKSIKVADIDLAETAESLRSLFKDPSRISGIRIYENYAVLDFVSHSSARKTANTYSGEYRLEWLNPQGVTCGNVYVFRPKFFTGCSQEMEIMLIGKGLYEIISN